jgi:radical SAM protein with 4Fe4S-binding SPASM domain
MSVSGIKRVLREIGAKKAIYYSLNSLVQRAEYSLHRSRLLSRLMAIQVEPTTRCNLRCEFCKSSVWGHQGHDMDFPRFQRLLAQFPHLVKIFIQGFGEPLLNKDFFKMVGYSKSKRIIVGTVTNGTLLKGETNQALIDSGIDLVLISFDGATPATYEAMRRGAHFDRVVENIRNLVQLRGPREKPRLVLNFTGARNNIHELPSVLRLAKDLGVDAVRAIEAYAFDYQEIEDRLKGKKLSGIPADVRRIILEAKTASGELSIPFYWDGRTSRQDVARDDKKIHFHFFKSCFISHNGAVNTCPFADPEADSLGNAFDQDFNEIWNNEAYVSLRKSSFRGVYPSHCSKCTFPDDVKFG